jgi:hypothetical protein
MMRLIVRWYSLMALVSIALANILADQPCLTQETS